MNILVGIDVQPIDEVESSMREFGFRYTRRLFTDHELDSCGDNPLTAASGLAARFAAKEAVLKILNTTVSVPPWKDIEVTRAPGGQPEIVLRGEAAELARCQGVSQISLSLSHGGGIATAAVVAQAKNRHGEENP
jgi:holo-[acyl-carrier protein] synthase